MSSNDVVNLFLAGGSSIWSVDLPRINLPNYNDNDGGNNGVQPPKLNLPRSASATSTASYGSSTGPVTSSRQFDPSVFPFTPSSSNPLDPSPPAAFDGLPLNTPSASGDVPSYPWSQKAVVQRLDAVQREPGCSWDVASTFSSKNLCPPQPNASQLASSDRGTFMPSKPRTEPPPMQLSYSHGVFDGYASKGFLNPAQTPSSGHGGPRPPVNDYAAPPQPTPTAWLASQSGPAEGFDPVPAVGTLGLPSGLPGFLGPPGPPGVKVPSVPTNGPVLPSYNGPYGSMPPGPNIAMYGPFPPGLPNHVFVPSVPPIATAPAAHGPVPTGTTRWCVLCYE